MLKINETSIGDVIDVGSDCHNIHCLVVVGFDYKSLHLASIFLVPPGWHDAAAMYGNGLKVDGIYCYGRENPNIIESYTKVGNIYEVRDIMIRQISDPHHIIEPRRFCKECIHRKCKHCAIRVAIEKQQS